MSKNASKKAGLEKTQVLLKKPAGRLNAGFSQIFQAKPAFKNRLFH
jgi:hypothetical protein